jgi:hypothetical protein
VPSALSVEAFFVTRLKNGSHENLASINHKPVNGIRGGPLTEVKNLKPILFLRRAKGAKYSYGRFVVLENYLSGRAT